MLSGAAGIRGIQTEEALKIWIQTQGLADPAVIFPALNRTLEAMVGEHWVLDPRVFQQP